MLRLSWVVASAATVSLMVGACSQPGTPEAEEGPVDVGEAVQWLGRGDGRACGHFSVTQTISTMVSAEELLRGGAFPSLQPGLEDGEFFLEHLNQRLESITLDSVDPATSSVTCSADYTVSFGENPPVARRIAYSIKPTIEKDDLLITVDDLSPAEEAIRVVARGFLAEGAQMAAASRDEGGTGSTEIFLYAERLPDAGLAEWRGTITRSEGTHRTMAIRTERPVEVRANVRFTCEDSLNTSWSDVRRNGAAVTVEEARIPQAVLTMSLRHGCNW